MDISSDDNEFRILIASDVHLGYAEKDSIRYDDSFRTFEEVLKIAIDNDVDFLLLGGDLFHENKPSSKSMKTCIEILRKYVLGDGEIKFKILSDQQINFSHSKYFNYINYEDENLNIKLPIFTIHGNHDDPTGKDAVGILDTLAATGLINYFGKQSNIDCIEVSPILLKKKNIKIALYGIGSLPEERFHKYIANDKVTFLELEQKNGKKEWFNLFVVHQNRVQHGNKYLPENCLTDLPDFVIWGHEHESMIKAQYNDEKEFYVYQPGSTVATSLSLGESKKKHCGLLKIRIDNTGEFELKLTSIPLKTVRDFIFETVSLTDYFCQNNIKKPTVENVEIFCTNKIEELIQKSKESNKNNSLLPLIRLRVEYSDDFLVLSSYHFGQKFNGKIANPKELLLFKPKKSKNVKSDLNMDLNFIEDMYNDEKIKNIDINNIIKEYFKSTNKKNKLNLLSEIKVTEIIKEIVHKEQNLDKLNFIIDWHIENFHNSIKNKNCLKEISNKRDLVLEMIKDFKEDLIKNDQKININLTDIGFKYMPKICKLDSQNILNSDNDKLELIDILNNDERTLNYKTVEPKKKEKNIKKEVTKKKSESKSIDRKSTSNKNKFISDYIVIKK